MGYSFLPQQAEQQQVQDFFYLWVCLIDVEFYHDDAAMIDEKHFDKYLVWAVMYILSI